MNNKKKVYNLIILDESGSMHSIKNMIISGFNEVVQTVKGVAKEFPEQEHFSSLVTFNTLKTKTLLDRAKTKKLKEIDGEQYQPNGGTPLFDAMGDAINHLRTKLAGKTDFNVLVTILTDGMENSSKEYNGADIKALVEELEEKNWTFTYIGADHDVDRFATTISIKNTLTFHKNSRGMKEMFETEKRARRNYSRKIRHNEDTRTGHY